MLRMCARVCVCVACGVGVVLVGADTGTSACALCVDWWFCVEEMRTDKNGTL